MRLKQDLGGLWPGEPLRQRDALGQIIITDLGPGDRGNLSAFRHLGSQFIAVLIGQINNQLERHHLDANLFFNTDQHFLSIVRTIEGLTLAVLAGAGMVAGRR